MSLLKGKQLTSPVNLTGSLFGTASYALTASYAMNGGGGGGGTPGGSNTQIQFNDNGTFNGVPVLIYTGSVLRATGSFSGSFTGDFYGTASWSTNAVTASYTLSSKPVGNNGEIQYNNNGVLGANSNLVFDDTANLLLVGKLHTIPVTDVFGGFVQGQSNEIRGKYSTALGNSTKAIGDTSLSAGTGSEALGNTSFALGEGVIASGSAQTVVGKYNTQGNDTALFVIGNGTNDTTRADLAVFGPNSSIKFSGSIDVETGNNITADRFIGTADLAVDSTNLGGHPAANYARRDVGNTFAEDQIFSKNVVIQGSASISYLTVVYETASVIYSTGSNQFGDAAIDVQTLYGLVTIPTGSLRVSGSTTITGSLNVTSGITGSLFGTSSWSSNAVTASYILNAVSSSFAATASFVKNAQTASFVTTLNQAVVISGSLVVSGSTNLQSSTGTAFSINADTLIITGSLIVTGSSVMTGSLAILGALTATSVTSSLFGTSSWSLNAVTSSHSLTASYIDGGFY